ncbi:hypothetical protein AAHA92_22048 [Salvia divinorum]|uniref:Uncharacterized protein n=1 Tax=Salvia divinorum TaxID=28513 RepID=A0ABD1GQV9_SALDI
MFSDNIRISLSVSHHILFLFIARLSNSRITIVILSSNSGHVLDFPTLNQKFIFSFYLTSLAFFPSPHYITMTIPGCRCSWRESHRVPLQIDVRRRVQARSPLFFRFQPTWGRSGVIDVRLHLTSSVARQGSTATPLQGLFPSLRSIRQRADGALHPSLVHAWTLPPLDTLVPQPSLGSATVSSVQALVKVWGGGSWDTQDGFLPPNWGREFVFMLAVLGAL